MYNARSPPSPSSPSRPNSSYQHHVQPLSGLPYTHGQPMSPTRNAPPVNGYPPHPMERPAERPTSTFFDPTSEARERRTSIPSSNYRPQSPELRAPPQYPSYPPSHTVQRSYEQDHHSPPSQYESRPNSSYPPVRGHQRTASDHYPSSPSLPKNYYSQNMAPPPPASANNERPPSSHSTRRADPMSFSNILSSSDPEPPRSPAERKQPPPSTLHDQRDNDKQPLPAKTHQYESQPSSPLRHIHRDEPRTNGTSRRTPPEVIFKTSNYRADMHTRTPSADKSRLTGDTDPSRPSGSRPKKVREIPEKDIQAQLAKIDAMDLSDIENAGFEGDRREYLSRSIKRMHDVEEEERRRRKRRRLAHVNLYSSRYGEQAIAARDNFMQNNEQSVWQDIQAQEVAEEKERKKVMQRTRRRETTKAKAEQQAAELKERAKYVEDVEEKEKLMKDAQRAEKKASATSKLLNGEDPNNDLREVTPMAPNLEGGIMTSFQMTDEAGPDQGKRRGGRTGGRLKKSKEQKRREKDLAAAAHERGDDLPIIAPKGEPIRHTSKRDSIYAKETIHSEKPPAHTSKAYEQMYEQIWRDIARKEIPKVYRVKESSLSTKQSNLRKTAQLAHKEARRWQQKTNKSNKDTQARAKRVMREMLSFWKRNEREERDQRKMAERQELELARKAEADREANRQKRKLNFLISQTELYSHFIGKKVRTDEVENSTTDVGGDVAVSKKTIEDDKDATKIAELPDGAVSGPGKVTNFEDLDFDNEDETALHEAAMANAQNAVKEAQDRARSFNNDQLQSEFDEGEMNFQNPTSLQSMDIAQPNMLTCQLKEYQIKGLNWLVNLYEQGINGILADEMGLGKTVQSISVMAYLAEVHNIWGPFLVIAPASTLHNWQQEIVRFVPGLKVLPYWGNAKDRKILRKFWDRKHITYRRDSPFHVLVTSYQLVVQDTQYFQKIRWQYMVLDEAQAIKSSQSSRWKSLLGFHCRNRLLLTGTPIQNNMQELWALLHFIMPSLFDSHDEFSDWFSKDIESHAQSNTKLNEDQLKRLHMILKPFMLRRIKKHVQKELGDKIEEDVFCDLSYRQRAYYSNLRNKISLLDLIEKAAVGDDQDTATLMNLVMQFRKVCNHPDLFERAETMSPVQFAYFAETASFLREGHNVEVLYSVRNHIEFDIPRLIGRGNGRLDIAGPDNASAGWRNQNLYYQMNIWTAKNIWDSSKAQGAFSWLPFIAEKATEVSGIAHKDIFFRAVDLRSKTISTARLDLLDGKDTPRLRPVSGLLDIVKNSYPIEVAKDFGDGPMHELLHVSNATFSNEELNAIEPCCRPTATAPPIELYCASQGVINEKRRTFFNVPVRRALFGLSEKTEELLLSSNIDPSLYPVTDMLPTPISSKARYTKIQNPSMRRFVTDSGKLAKLDQLLGQLKEGGHRVLLYFQMTRMIDLMEEYLTYRNYKYCRLDGSTKLEDRRDTVADFQNRSDIFVFLLSTRAGGLGINLTAADTVIFYDSDWNPTIDSQAMDRAHRLGQTRQVTVYRMITRGTIEERIRKRALQKEEVQRVVISGGAGAQVDFNTRSRENRTKDIAMWLADDDQAKEIEKKEAEIAEKEAKEERMGKKPKKAQSKKKLEVSLDDMYHEGEGHFDDSAKPSGAATPIDSGVGTSAPGKKRKGVSKRAKTVKEKLAYIDGGA